MKHITLDHSGVPVTYVHKIHFVLVELNQLIAEKTQLQLRDKMKKSIVYVDQDILALVPEVHVKNVRLGIFAGVICIDNSVQKTPRVHREVI